MVEARMHVAILYLEHRDFLPALKNGLSCLYRTADLSWTASANDFATLSVILCTAATQARPSFALAQDINRAVAPILSLAINYAVKAYGANTRFVAALREYARANNVQYDPRACESVEYRRV